MDSHGQNYQNDPHNAVAEGEDEPHHEKVSMLNKVKAKAKKITDTIKKHGHGHSHSPERDQDDAAETVEGLEDHGPTTPGAAPVKGAIPSQVENTGHSRVNPVSSTAPDERKEAKINDPDKGLLAKKEETQSTGQPRVNSGKARAVGEEPYGAEKTPASHSPGVHGTKGTDPTKTFVHGEEQKAGQQPRVNLQRPMGLEEDPHSPKDKSQAQTASNYQTKVTDPSGTGGEVAGVSPILSSFNKMKVYDEPESKPGPGLNKSTTTHNQFPTLPAGSHDRFSPEPAKTIPEDPQLLESFHTTKPEDQQPKPGQGHNISTTTHNQSPALPFGSHDQFSPEAAKTIREDPQLPESFHSTKPEDQHPRGILEKPSNQSSFNEKISPATSATKPEDQYPQDIFEKPSNQSSFTEKIPSATSATKREDQHQDALDISEKPSKQSSYTEKIASATSPIYGKAISAKNVVATKLGYGEKGDTVTEDHLPRDISEKPSNQSSFTENISSATSATKPEDQHPQDISEKPSNQSSYTEKITSATSPIYNKAIFAENVVATKLGYGEKDDTITEHETSGDGANTVKSKSPGTGTESESGVIKGQNKGGSMKNYIAEKLRPGEEDRALSEVITESLNKPKEEVEKNNAESKRPMGKVTESDEVARRLCEKDENDESLESSNVNNQEMGMVGKLRGTVGSWFGMGGDSQSPTSQQSSPHGKKGFPRPDTRDELPGTQSADERRLQESAAGYEEHGSQGV